MNELLHCPFCGGEAEMGVNKDSTVHEYFVGCMNCHIRLYKIGYKRFYTEADAIKAWNTRAQIVFGLTLDQVRQMMKRDIERERTCKNKAPRYLDFLCSECGFVHYIDDNNCTGDGNEWNYCPNCGAKVVNE